MKKAHQSEQKKRTRKINSTILIAFLTISLSIIAVVNIFAIIVFSSASTKSAVDYSNKVVTQVRYRVDSYVNDMTKIADFLSANVLIHSFLQGEDVDIAEIKTQLLLISGLREDIINIMVFCTQTDTFVSNHSTAINLNVDIKNTLWFKRAIGSSGAASLSASYVQNIFLDSYAWVVSLSKGIVLDGITKGVILIDLNYDSISEICRKVSLEQKGYIFIVNTSGDVVFHPSQQLIFSGITSEPISEILSSYTREYRADGKYHISTQSEISDWVTVGVIYENEITKDLIFVYVLFGIMLIMSVGVSIFASIIVSRKITSPIEKLRNSMKELESGNLAVRADESTHNEVGELAVSFNDMTCKINELVTNLHESNAEKRKSEIRSLQYQINPHFLYNTLDTIMWIAELNNQSDIVDMTSNLSKLFRSSLNNSDELIPLHLELENLKSYLIIQQYRYKDKLTFTISADKEIESYNIIKLILQPLVENAIYHGIKPQKNGGNIDIIAVAMSGNLVITIKDNGVGMSQQQIDSLLNASDSIGSGIGVKNVVTRINLYFGTGYGVTYDSTLGEGTTAVVVLPII